MLKKSSNERWNFRDVLNLGFYGSVLAIAVGLLANTPRLKAEVVECCGDPTAGCAIQYDWTCSSAGGCNADCCTSNCP
jgi:hypothetical protein